MARASKKRKRNGKNRESSFFLPKKTRTMFTKGQHFVSNANIATARQTTTFLVFFLGRICLLKFFAASVSLSDIRGPIKKSRTPSPIWLPKQSLVKTPKKPKRPKTAELVIAIKDHVRS